MSAALASCIIVIVSDLPVALEPFMWPVLWSPILAFTLNSISVPLITISVIQSTSDVASYVIVLPSISLDDTDVVYVLPAACGLYLLLAKENVLRSGLSSTANTSIYSLFRYYDKLDVTFFLCAYAISTAADLVIHSFVPEALSPTS